MIQLFRELYKDKFFYQLYIQEEGVAEAEFEADVRTVSYTHLTLPTSDLV